MEDRLRPDRLVPHHPQSVAGRGQRREAWHRVGVEVIGSDGVAELSGRGIGQHRTNVKIGAEQLEDLGVIAAARDDRPESGEKGQPWDAQMVGPGRPGARFVDQGLPDVEDDRADRQRERSCQLVPPIGMPGSRSGRWPVRRSICSRPRR